MKTNAFRCSLWVVTLLAGLLGVTASAAPPLVKTVPWVASNQLVPHTTYNAKTVTLKGTCDRAASTLLWTWDFGDGSAVATGTVTNKYVVEASHAYSAPDGTVFTARLTIQDTLTGETGTNVYYVTVQPKSLEVEANVAIDQGLWYLWKTANRSGTQYNWVNNPPDGQYYGYSGNTTASAVQAFEGQGHLENQPDNPYSEAVRGGIDYLTANLAVQSMSLQGGENPDSNGNTIGLYWNSGSTIYETGAVMDALVATGTPNATARTGNTTYVLGKTYQSIVQDMVDMYAWGQGDLPSYYGAWQYAWNVGNDNSASQWAAIGMIAAERHFGCTVPQWVKDRNLPWLNASYNSDRYFGYTSTGANRWYSTGPCGMVQLSFDGKDVTDSKWVACQQRIAENWSTFITVGDAKYYAWYSFTKAMRVALPAPVDTLSNGKKWYGDNVNGLARLLVNLQNADGSWPYDGWPYVGYQTAAAWNLIILSPTLFKSGSPVAVAAVVPNPGIVGQLITLNGSASYHQDASRHIVAWDWDLDNNGSFEVSGPVTSLTFPNVSNYPVKLRVTDDSVPPLTAETIVTVVINTPPLAPTANAGRPYVLCPQAKPWFLDGRGSVNPDEGQHQAGDYPGDTIKLYAWDLDGSGNYNNAFGATPDVTGFFTQKGPGSYLIQLRVTDNTSRSYPGSGFGDLSSTASAQVIVLPSTDPDCDCVTLTKTMESAVSVGLIWTALPGASSYNIYRGAAAGGPYAWLVATTQLTLTDINVMPGLTYYYVVRPTALNGDEACQSNEVTATTNTAPLASAGADQAIEQLSPGGMPVRLDGSASTDDGVFQALTYSWREGSQNLGSGVTISPTLGWGSHEIELAVFDGRLTSTDTVIVNITDTTPPETRITGGPAEGAFVNDAVITLIGGGSDNSSLPADLTYSFTIDNGTASGFGPAAYAMDSLPEGPHSIAVVARDAHGNHDLSPVVRNFVVDRTPPGVGSLQVTPGVSTAAITWQTDEESRVVLTYTPAGGTAQQVTVGSFTTAHSVSLSNLDLETVYDIAITVTDRAGNATVANISFATLPLPDLIAGGIVLPAAAYSGRPFQISWTVTNQGDAPATGTWSEIVELSADNQVGGDILLGTFPFTGTIAPGQTVTRTQTVSTAADLTGIYHLIATANSNHQIYELHADNNSAVSDGTIEVTEAPVITRFAWQGAALSNGERFIDKGTFTVLATHSQGVAAAEFYYKPSGSANSSLVARDDNPADGWSAIWDIAAIADGPYTVTVRVFDAVGAWTELSRDITVALAVPPAPVIVSPASGLTVQVPAVTLNLTARPNVDISIYRNDAPVFSGAAANDGSLNYATELPAGASIFKAVAVNRAGPSAASNAVTVIYEREFPLLSLSFANNTVTEGESVMGTVGIPQAEARDVTVQITTNKASQVAAVAPVVIPAGATSATFTLSARQDSEIELLTTLIVTAAADEHRSAAAELFLGDDDYPTLELTIGQSSVAESYGTVVGVIRRSPVSDRSLRVTIQNSNPAKASTPEYVDIPANQTEKTFSITVINNTLDDDNQLVKLRGLVLIGSTSVAQSPEVSLEVRDDDGPSLSLEMSNDFISEGASVNATLRRSGAANTESLVVALSSTPPGQLSTVATVTIPAGLDQATFTVSAINNAAVNGTRNVSLRASAASFTDGISQLTVTDENKAELTVSGLSAPPVAATESNATVNYQINNFGSAPAAGPFFERIFLSMDLSPSADDLLVRQVDFTGTLAAGGSYARNVTVLMPRAGGLYYLIVTVDAGNQVVELNETNNTAVLMQAIEVRAAYTATVQSASKIVPANTPMVFTGSATKENGAPATFSMVNIHIKLNGTVRIISAITNSLGQFSVTWTPLRNEGGVYTIGATHPGTDGAPTQDTFEILTMGFDAPQPVTMHETETVVVEATLRNPNGRDLHGLAISTAGVPAGLSITPTTTTTTLAAGGTLAVPLTVSAHAGFSGNGAFPLTVTTTEGVTMQALIYVNVGLYVPSLSFSVESLDGSVLRGDSKSVSFTITNNGGLETGAVQLLLPAVPWISLSCTSPLPSIPPGGSAEISLLLTPGVSVPLTLYTGSMVINLANGAGRSLGYAFRVVSSLMGDLTIEVADELTFFTAAAPLLAGAQVVVRDAITSAQVAAATTGATGNATFPNLPEGWYKIDVSAAEHDGFSGNYYVHSGQNNTKQVFISKQLVTYSWKVEEVQIEDVYRVTVETKFETNVPAPVVTASPSSIDVADLVALGQTKIVNITLENHGFIAAQNSRFRFSDHPFYSFTPLVTNVGTIPAKSSMVVPVVVRRTGVFGDNGEIITEAGSKPGLRTKRAPGGGSSVPCGATGAVDYNYPCGEWLIEKVVALAVSGVQGDCGGTGTGTSAYVGYITGFYYGGSSGPSGGTTTTSNGSVSFTSPDPCLAVCLARAVADCAIGFTPAGCIYNIAQCVFTPSWDGCIWTVAGCVADATGVGAWVNGANCIYSFGKCYYQYGGASGGSGSHIPGPRAFPGPTESQFVLDAEFRNFAPDVAAAWSRCESVLRMYELHYGSKELVVALGTQKGNLAMAEYDSARQPGSPDGAFINADEAIGMNALAADAGLDPVLVQRAVDRWNHTMDYHARGIRELADVPAGESTDFIDDTSMRAIAGEIIVAYDTSRAKGFLEPFDEFLTQSSNLRQTLQGNQGGTCATVKIQLSQDVVMTRTAFRATLELQNERTDGAITQVGFNLQIRDDQGQPAQDLFNVQVTKLTGLGAIDGTGEIPTSATGSAQWTLIPRDTAAQEFTKHYTVGGIIHYTQNGTEFNIPVENVPITVRPDASLSVKYFHQRDVLSDDPHTAPIEPSIPYKLAVMVENNGHGDAGNLRIISGQPQIVDNEKGLFIDFKIIATEVDGMPLSPSLTADFGTLSPGRKKIATWYMTSTLQGLFTDYSATFEHVTGLGDTRLSLIENLEIHEMIRMIRAQGALDDGAPDFLTNDVKDANDYPDTIHYSNGGTAPVTVRQTGAFSGAPTTGDLTITLTADAFTGWSYIRLPDPAAGNFRLVSATRNDGRVLPLDFNVWQSNRTFIGGGRLPLYENILHLVDNDSSGVYTLVYQPLVPPDTTPPVSYVNALPSLSSVNIPVTWSGSDNQSISKYDIYVSTDGGAYTLWGENTTETGGLFVGSIGNTYRFYSIATDQAGNTETKAPVAEASTLVGVVNQPPVIAALADATVNEGDVFTLQASADDPDGPSASIRFSIGSDRAGVVIDPVTGIIRWNTSEADGGFVAHVIVTATDSGFPAALANEAFAITVMDVNTAPTLAQVGPQTLASNGVLIVDTDAADGDSPMQTITYALATAPEGASIGSSNGIIHWTPNTSQAGQTYVFTVSATDNGSPPLSANMSFTATVLQSTDHPPVFTHVPVVLWLKGKTYTLGVSASDPDGDPISLTANTSTAAGAVFSDTGNGHGSLSWNTTGAAAATYHVPVTATAKGLTANATLHIKVENDELYWQWAKAAFGDLPDGYDLSLMNMDADPDGDSRGNVHEMALLTHPLVADEIPLKMDVDVNDPFAVVHLNLHRRVGSDQYVELDVASNENLGGPWQKAGRLDWSAFIDMAGDDDKRPETEAVDFYLFELYPARVPARKFYRVESTKK